MADSAGTFWPDLQKVVHNTGRVSEEASGPNRSCGTCCRGCPGTTKFLANLGSYGAWLQICFCRIGCSSAARATRKVFFTAIDVTGDKTQAQGSARRSEHPGNTRHRGEGLFTAARTFRRGRRRAHHQAWGRSRPAVGMISIIVVTLVVVSALQMDKLPYLSPVSTYSAYFDDAGGLSTGDVVMVIGGTGRRGRRRQAGRNTGRNQVRCRSG